MGQIEEAYCSFEISKLLKEKGFDEICYRIYNTQEKELWGTDGIEFQNHQLDEETITAPTHQMALAWLREEHKIVIQIGIKITGASYYYQIWDYSIIHPNKFIGGMIDLRECAEDFNSYEDAVEAALKYSLENLI